MYLKHFKFPDPDCYKLINNTRDNSLTTMSSTETTLYQAEKM